MQGPRTKTHPCPHVNFLRLPWTGCNARKVLATQPEEAKTEGQIPVLTKRIVPCDAMLDGVAVGWRATQNAFEIDVCMPMPDAQLVVMPLLLRFLSMRMLQHVSLNESSTHFETSSNVHSKASY